MSISSSPIIRLRLAQLSAHLVVALIALVVVGGATRVMGAGLACPDWPLCFGSFLPVPQMNIQVFLEWFHRLDALLVALGLVAQLIFGLIFRSELPKWLPWAYSFVALLVYSVRQFLDCCWRCRSERCNQTLPDAGDATVNACSKGV